MPCVCLKTVEAQAVTVSTQKQQRHYETDTVSRKQRTREEQMNQAGRLKQVKYYLCPALTLPLQYS